MLELNVFLSFLHIILIYQLTHKSASSTFFLLPMLDSVSHHPSLFLKGTVRPKAKFCRHLLTPI